MKKIKINNLIKNYPILLFYIFGNFVNALLLRLMTAGSFGFRAMFFDLGFILFLASFSFLIGEKRRNIYYFLTSLVMVIICIINSMYYNYYASFVSVSLLATSVFVQGFEDVIIDFALKATDWIYLWEIIGLIILFRKINQGKERSKKFFSNTLKIALFSVIIGCALPPYNSWSRLGKLWNRVSVVNSWGPYIYQIDDLIQSMRPTFNNVFGHDQALKIVSDYYEENKYVPTKNNYTGIFEGKNVIVIHAESLQTFVLDLKFNNMEVTPNINKLVSSGMFFSNYYAQVGVGTSSDTEFTYATSLLPANNGTVFVNYYNNKYVTIQNLLKNKGYYVFSMHGNVGDFWNRETMHTNMGYDKFYSKSSFEMDEEFGLGLSDKSFFKQAVPKIKEIKEEVGEPYYGTLITLTNHTPWNDTEKYSDYKVTMDVKVDNNTITSDYLNDTMMGRYIKSVHYMDEAIGEFISDMDSQGLLENTVIIIYGDHDARLGKKQFDYLYNYDPVMNRIRTEEDDGYISFNNYDYELSKNVPLIIWTKDMQNAIKIDTPAGMIDVLPTVGNMLNVYNKYSLGHDIMNTKKENGIVVFKDGSYITDRLYYNAKTGEVYALTSGVISDDYIKQRSYYADKIVEISDKVITYDLLKDLK